MAGQDNFVSYTVKAEEQANMERIRDKKSRAAAPTPLEPLIVTLLKSFTDDSDLSAKLKALYTASSRAGRASEVVGACAPSMRARERVLERMRVQARPKCRAITSMTAREKRAGKV